MIKYCDRYKLLRFITVAAICNYRKLKVLRLQVTVIYIRYKLL